MQIYWTTSEIYSFQLIVLIIILYYFLSLLLLKEQKSNYGFSN